LGARGSGEAADKASPREEERPLRSHSRPDLVFSAIVFDCDGVLLNTEHAWTRAETALAARYGYIWTAADKRAVLGTSLEETGRIFERILGLDGWAERLTIELLELADSDPIPALPLPGAQELVSTLQGRVPVAVASNTTHARVVKALAIAGFADKFNVVVCADDVPAPKPAPDLYLRACELLWAEPTQTAALEDTPIGVAAARAAGCFTIGIPSTPGVQLPSDATFSSLEDPALRSLLGNGR
jgi:HAD superfamily hydrolase (TIGR01509 family)